MAAFVVAIWIVCVTVIQGQTPSDDTLNNRVTLLEKQGSEQSRLIATLFERLDRQDAQIQSQTKTIETQQQRLHEQDDQLQEESKTLQNQRQLLEHQDKVTGKLWSIVRRQSGRIQSQERAMQLMRSTINLKASYASFANENNEHNTVNSVMDSPSNRDSNRIAGRKVDGNRLKRTQLSSMKRARNDPENMNRKRLVVAPEGPIAFHAVIDKGQVPNIGINQNIVFDVVLENLGGGYHNQHGVFIAPANGVYIFSVSILSYVNAYPEFRADLKKNGVVLARVFGHGDNHRHDQGSVSIVTNLTQGNEVWVSLEYPGGDSIWGGRYTSFMGCLMYPL